MQKVSLFIPCLVDAIMGSVGEATARLLSRMGFALDYHEKQTCCGGPAVSAGYQDLARAAAKHFITIFEKDAVIVSPSGSCVNTVRHDYPRLLADEPAWEERARALAERVYELSQFLVDVAGIEDVNARYNGKIAYHNSCHVLRHLGVEQQPLRLLRKVRGAELVNLNKDKMCCGFGGQFAIKYPYLSSVIVADKVRNFINSGAEVMVLSDPGCLLNLRGYLHRHHPQSSVQHLAEFLAANMV